MPAPRPQSPASYRPSSSRQPGRAVLAGLAFLLATGCGALHDDARSSTDQPPSGTTRSSQSAAHLAADAANRVTGSPQPVLTAPPDLGALLPARDPDGPEHAAVAIILDGLTAEGLLLTSIDTDLVDGTNDRATVAVTVAHSPGHGHPTQSRYELDLTRTTDGWTLTGHREQP